jgi:stage II sporulation protein AA (anti-sigma F factor antagonist)
MTHGPGPILKIRSEDLEPGVGLIELQGSLDASNVSLFRSLAEGFFLRGIYRLVVDLGKANYVASAGFSAFLACLDTARSRGGGLAFARPTLQVREVFSLMGLLDSVTVAEDVPSAAAALRGTGTR